ncbi:MAG: peptide chain release factor 2 [Anaerolineae bacterium]|nr:peptide chain release factor 2 [Anaerolineae bacterium]
MEDLMSRLNETRQTVEQLMVRLDIARQESEAHTLEEESAQPDFWDDPQHAQRTMRRLSRLKNNIEAWNGAYQQIVDAIELAELGDPDMDAELAAEADTITHTVDRLAFRAKLSGKFDAEDVYLAIHAGAGGTDAQDWAQMLLRMYLRWAERRGFKTEIVDQMAGDEAGIKSATVAIQGDYVYGFAKSERGVHRLVRLSPFDSASRRHTSFALVEVWPDVQVDIDLVIDEKDLQIDTFRSSGAGGQNVQKNETAIRITHLPTGLVVSCQNERSQTQNKDRAMQVLKIRLLDLEHQKQEEEFAELKGEHVSAGWGNAIRSYVLHPYKIVKDTRTAHESGNPQAVLDGDLDGFMEAYLDATVGDKT